MGGGEGQSFFSSYIFNLKNDIRIRKNLVLRENLNIYRMYFVYIILIFRFWNAQIIISIKNMYIYELIAKLYVQFCF